MASRIDIPISYSPGSIDQILKDFDTIIKQADISDVFAKDQDKIRAQFATIAETIQKQLGSGKIDLTQVNFTGLEKNIEDFARKVAFVLNEAFEKEVEPYAKKITAITDEIVNKQKELADLNQQMADIGGKERDEFKSKFGLSRMPTLDKGEAKRRLGTAEEELKADSGNVDLQKKVELYRELLEMLSTEKERKKQIQEQISKKEVEVLTLTNQKKAVQIDLDKAQAKLGVDAANYSQKLLDLNRLLILAKENGIDLSEEQIKLLKEQASATEKDTDAGKKNQKNLIARAGASFSYGLILGQLRQAFRASLTTVLELDKAMTEAAIVTEMNREEAYKLIGTYQQLARDTGLATSEISGIVVEFLKQGRTMNESMELAKVAAMSAKVAGIDAREAVDYLTAAVNGFQLAASQAGDIADKFSAISAASATDFEELAVAMSKVAPVAYTAGVGVDFMMGVLAKGLETTREAPENIGTAFKTIFARMREVTDIGKATEDGMSLNRVEKALESIGVPLRDVSGQFRNLEDVLFDVGNQWDTLTSIEQAYIATALAGTRQQPRLLAIFNDFARTKELIQISTDATGQLAFQHAEYMAGAEAALAQLKTAWEGFIMAFTDTGIVIDSIRMIGDVINGITGFFEIFGDSAFRNIALIGLVSVALGGLTAKKLIDMQTTQISLTYDQMKNTLTDTQKDKYDELTQAITNKNAAADMEINKQRAQVLGLKTGVIPSIKSAVGAIGLHIKAMIAQAAVALATTLIIAGIGLVFAGLVALYKELSKGAAEYSKEIAENNGKLNDLGSKKSSIENLVEKFEDLNRKVVKTKQDMEELKNIAQELSEVKVGDVTYQLTRRDITGNVVLNKAAYENFLAAVEVERQKLLDANLSKLKSALSSVKWETLSNVFEKNPVLLAQAQDVGYSFGAEFLNSMARRGFSQTNINKAMSFLRDSMNQVDPSAFFDIGKDIIGEDYTLSEFITDKVNSIFYAGDVDSSSLQTMKDYAFQMMDSLINEIPTSEDELTARIAEFLDNTTLSAAEKSNFQEGIFNWWDNLEVSFDPERAEKFAQTLSEIFLNTTVEIEKGLKELERTGDLTTKTMLENNLNEYRESIKEINEMDLTQGEKDLLIKLLGQGMQDQAILDLLTDPSKEFKYDIEFVAKVVESGTSVQDFYNLITDAQDKIADMTKRERKGGRGNAFEDVPLTAEEQSAKLEMYGDAMEKAFNAKTVEEYTGAYDDLRKVFGGDFKEEVVKLSSALGLLNATTAATTLSDQGKNIQSLLKLPEQIAKGDFSNYSDMVAEFGIEAVNSLLQGGATELDSFFTTQKNLFKDNIEKSIANIRATREALGGDLSDGEVEQIAQLELMLDYYDQIAGVEQLRVAKVKEVKDLLKETNDLYALQEKLSKGGMSADNPFMKLLDKLTTASESQALSKLGTQLQADITKLNSLGKFVNGEFLRNPNVDIYESELASKNMMETLTQLIDIQTASYNKQAKVIEERYKTELDAIKSAHDEKWSQIDFNNKLLETEEKIIDARRQLMGLALSGAMRGEYKDAQKALENLQREREKTIETQMLDDAQKELEQQRNDDLIAAQTTFTAAIEKYTNAITGLAPVNPGVQTRVRPEDIAIKFDKTTVSLDMLKATMDQLSIDGILEAQKTGELIDVNGLMIDEMGLLIKTIENWKIQMNVTKSTSGANTDGIGT
jgi:TP901 family phage tail tape measure protein